MRGFSTFRDDRHLGHAVSVCLWSSRGAAFATHGRVVEVMAGLRDAFPTPPRITAGAARVVTASRAA
jgi:hypothetical protein